MSKYMLASASLLVLAGCVSSPEPLTEDERTVFAQYIKETATAGQEAPVRSITLYEAMARALKYNLDHRVANMETALAQRDFDLSRYDLLPQIVANAGYANRDNDPGASSLSLLTGQQSLEPSTSSEREVFTADLTASYNVLDFGLSYIRARQIGDEALIQEERRRKVINEIIEDVRSTYWRAASAERLTRELDQIKQDTKKAFEESRRLYQDRRSSPLSALSYQRELNDILSEAQQLQNELLTAKQRLALLMNLPAGEKFEIALPDRVRAPVTFNMPLGVAIDTALSNRPEVREAAYRIRMGKRDLKTALLEALPGIDIYGGLNYDSNDFLFNNNYVAWGARASWNLIRVFETPARRRRAKAGLMLEQERALATAMAVTSQVHIGMVRYIALRDTLNTAERAQNVQGEILEQISVAHSAKSASYQTYVRERMNMIISEARYDIAYAELQNAFAGLYTAIGYDPFGADITGTEDISTLTQSLQQLWQSRERATAR